MNAQVRGNPFSGANGTLPIQLGWEGAHQKFSIWGGPFDKFPAKHAFGVCVRAERVPAKVDLHLPIKDFAVPTDDEQVTHVLKETLRAALDGKTVYVGCMGGWGRTGLFLALLAKACGVSDPVGYVRANYTSRAVETDEQFDYVMNFDVTGLKGWLMWHAWSARVKRLLFGR